MLRRTSVSFVAHRNPAAIGANCLSLSLFGVKAHRNGIKKPKSNKYPSLRGVDPKFLRNMRFAKKHNVLHAGDKKQE
ncbi:ribosomal protein L29e [Capsaspora owczarzaki ATCC 30864]|uniref:60S ribosomal protein L29 n=1 Tax=Capsaspora owczarzaki (strain ATCC 30864) TaxID=595528 RepID=A0A0D2X195_CAPO3|nr:ribosomal protein L29e [Capsaspora owczarzaki ATCC 30864]